LNDDFVKDEVLSFAEAFDMGELVLEQQMTEQQRLYQQEQNGLANIISNPTLNQGRALVVAAAAICGTNFPAVKMLDSVIPVSAAAAARFSLAAVAVAAFVFQQEMTEDRQKAGQFSWEEMDTIRKERQAALFSGTEVGFWYCFAYMTQALGLHTVDANKSAFFNALAVIVVPLLDSAFKGRKMGYRGVGSVLMAIAGVALLQMGPKLAATASPAASTVLASAASALSVTPGDLLCLAQALFFGIGYWRLENSSVSFPGQSSRIIAGQLAAVAAGSVAYWLYESGVPSVHLIQEWFSNPFVVEAIAWTGLVSTALALYLETIALKVVSASELTVLMTSVSLWASLFAFLGMGEVLSPIGMAGGLMILSGCIISSTGPKE
jgi:drug/metabolite transporter (DMT)-like permease